MSAIVTSDRVKKLKAEFLNAPRRVCANRSRLLTEYWKMSDGEPITIRRAKAFRHILNGIPNVIRDNELDLPPKVVPTTELELRAF